MIFKKVVAASGKRPFVRMRTITAPTHTSASKDPLDYGDVNLVSDHIDLTSLLEENNNNYSSDEMPETPTAVARATTTSAVAFRASKPPRRKFTLPANVRRYSHSEHPMNMSNQVH